MSYKVVMAAKAQANLDNLTSYIAKALHAPATAERLYFSIIHRVNDLADHTDEYPIYLTKDGVDYRKVSVKRYLVFYSIGADVVSVTAIYHGSQNIDHLL